MERFIVTLGYIGSYLFLLALFSLVAFGLGRLFLGRPGATDHAPAGITFSLTLATGMGLFAVALQALAVAGALNRGAIAVVTLVGAVSAAAAWRRTTRPHMRGFLRPASFGEGVALLAMTAAVLHTLFAPFRPGMEWDELMYHLPHAAQWAQSGQLSINPWLRYPWFPYDFNLLYASALLVSDATAAHLIHAAAGWLCAALIFHTGRIWANRTQAALAAAIWLYVSRWFFEDALIDIGVALFVFSACVAFWLWWRSPESGARWLLLSAFLLGVAVGSKYQALMYLPLFGAALLMRERRLRSIAAVTVAFLIPCGYWYLRNAVMTGDPFNPLGGPVFGFTDWNLADFQEQRLDVGRGEFPHGLLWPALIALLFRDTWRSADWRLAALFGCYAITVWFVMTGGLARYLMPAYPVLILLAARGWAWLAGTAARRLAQLMPVLAGALRAPRSQRVALVLVALFLARASIDKLRLDWGQIAPTPELQEAYLSSHLAGYDVLRHLTAVPHAGIYQCGVSDALFYAPQPIWGDSFGPGRFRDTAPLPAGEMAASLARRGIDTLVINHARFGWVAAKADFGRYFEPIFERNGVTAYHVVLDRREGGPAQALGAFQVTTESVSGQRPRE